MFTFPFYMRQRVRELPTAASLPKWHQQPELDKAAARSCELSLGLRRRKDPGT